MDLTRWETAVSEKEYAPDFCMFAKTLSNSSIGLVKPNSVRIGVPSIRQFISYPTPPGETTPPLSGSNAATPPMGKPYPSWASGMTMA